MLKAATVQFNHRPGDKAYNGERLRHFCAQAAHQDIQIIAFPEMCLTGYWHVRHLERRAIDGLAEPVPDGPSTALLRQLAAQHHMLVAAGLIERATDGALYNTYVAALPDGTVHRHRKLHCFISPHMASGAQYTVFATPFDCQVGMLICWDNNLVENVRLTALAGAEVLLAPHQTGGCRSRSPHAMGAIDPALWHNRHADPHALKAQLAGPKGREWLMRWLPSRAHDNGLFVLFSNGVGLDDDEVRTGNAMVIDCYGRILAESTSIEDDMVCAEVDLSLLDLCTGRRWLRGRRPELYGALSRPTGRELAPRAARFSPQGTSS